MFDKINQFLVGRLDADKNGKVNLDDAYAKFGQGVVRAFLLGGGIFSIIAFVIGRATK